MDTAEAAQTLAALSHQDRLRVFQLLMHRSPEGISAGEVSRQLGIAPSSLTFHLGVLKHAGLIRSYRQRRSIIYLASLDSMTSVLRFLVNDCCRGDPSVCGFEIGPVGTSGI